MMEKTMPPEAPPPAMELSAPPPWQEEAEKSLPTAWAAPAEPVVRYGNAPVDPAVRYGTAPVEPAVKFRAEEPHAATAPQPASHLVDERIHQRVQDFSRSKTIDVLKEQPSPRGFQHFAGSGTVKLNTLTKEELREENVALREEIMALRGKISKRRNGEAMSEVSATDVQVQALIAS